MTYIKTIYKCDRCKRETTEIESLKYWKSDGGVDIELCKECFKKLLNNFMKNKYE